MEVGIFIVILSAAFLVCVLLCVVATCSGNIKKFYEKEEKELKDKILLLLSSGLKEEAFQKFWWDSPECMVLSPDIYNPTDKISEDEAKELFFQKYNVRFS